MVITATPYNGKRVKSFLVKVNDGSFVSVEESDIQGNFTGNVNDGYNFNFVADKAYSYEFKVEFEEGIVRNDYIGKVTDMDNDAPIANASVVAYDVVEGVRGNAFAETTTGEDGTFTIKLGATTYELEVKAENYYTYSTQIVMGETDTDETATPVELKKMTVGGSTTLTNGTTVPPSKNGLNIVFDYESGNLTASTVEGSNTGAQLDGRVLTFTGIKDKYAMAKFTYTNQGGGTETDAGIGISFFDGTNEVALVFRKDGARLTAPAWVSTIGLELNSGYRINNTGSYDLMIVRADTTYYMFSKPAASPNWEMIYSATETELRTLGEMGDTEAKLTGEAGLFIRMTVGPTLSINAQFSNFETAEGEEAINAIIGSHTITVNDVANAEIVVTGDEVTSEAGEGKTVYTVPLGKTVQVKVNCNEGYEVSDMLINDFSLGVQNSYIITKLGSDITLQASVAAIKTFTVTGNMTSSLNGFDTKEGNTIIFTRDNGRLYTGEVVKGDGTMTYSVNLPEGNYNKVTYLNYYSSEVISVSDSTAVDVEFTSYGYNAVTHGGLVVQEDGSLLTNINQGGTQETAMSDITFIPSSQVLTFGYTVTGITENGDAGNKTFIMPGMFVTDNTNFMRIVNMEAGDVLCFMAKDDYTSRMKVQDSEPWIPFGSATGYYTFDKPDYRLTVKFVLSDYNLQMYVKIGTEDQWRTVFGADNAFNIYNRYETGTAVNGNPGTDYIDTLYSTDRECKFGISMRRDKVANQEVNVVQFSDIWYTIEDKA